MKNINEYEQQELMQEALELIDDYFTLRPKLWNIKLNRDMARDSIELLQNIVNNYYEEA